MGLPRGVICVIVSVQDDSKIAQRTKNASKARVTHHRRVLSTPPLFRYPAFLLPLELGSHLIPQASPRHH